MSLDLTRELNPEQKRAVMASDGPALVIAAAGTGKTRTLTHRVAWLVREKHIYSHEILLLTFTNRAAREMLERAANLVNLQARDFRGGTFHSTACKMLRKFATNLDYTSDFTILDEDDSTRLMKACISELDLKDKKFPKPAVLGSVFGLAASRAADLEKTVTTHFDGHAVDIDGILKVHALYEKKKRALNGMDFDDLLTNGLKLLREHPQVVEYYQNRIRYILVDEYQDTNIVQSAFVNILAAKHKNLMVVGDDFQSIYSWRGAEVQHILDFQKQYPDAQMFKLEENYRSVPGILEVANKVIEGNPEQFQKVLRATRPDSVKPTLVKLTDGGHQARYIVDKVRKLLASGDVKPKEIAVLYRSHFHAMELQLELGRAHLNFVLMSGVRFFEQAHIKDVCCLPRLAANPADALAFGRLMELFPKVGPKKVQTMWAALGEHLNLRDPAKRAQLASLLPKQAQPLWKTIESRLFPPEEKNAEVLDRPDEIIFRFTEAFYSDFATNKFDNAPQRIEDIQELCTFSAKYKNTADFLSEMALLTNLDATQNKQSKAEASENAIWLTTVHQAKGLEWKAVFVLWMTEGMFPSSKSTDEGKSDAEERRLFYVAVTRAKDYLWLCAPAMRKTRDGGVQMCMPSRFLNEIPSALLQLEKAGGSSPPPQWHRRW